jgi:hypothetical protein
VGCLAVTGSMHCDVCVRLWASLKVMCGCKDHIMQVILVRCDELVDVLGGSGSVRKESLSSRASNTTNLIESLM